jgi:nitrogen regulatory protein PII
VLERADFSFAHFPKIRGYLEEIRERPAAHYRWESAMKRIEAIISRSSLDSFKEAAPRLGISEFELVEVYRLGPGCETVEGGKGLYRGIDYRAELLPRLRVEFVTFDDDVQKTLHDLLQVIDPESISVFRLDQEVRIALAQSDANSSFSSGGEISEPEVPPRAIGPNSRLSNRGRAIMATRAAPICH